MYYPREIDFKADEIIEYLRKSRSDDPMLTVEEVLEKHETILEDWAVNHLGQKVPENNIYREIVSGETIDDRPEIKEVLRLIESPKVKAILVVEVQRLSRGDLEDAGRLIKLLRYTNTMVITPPKTYDLRDDYDRDAFERELKRGNEFLEYQKKIMNRGRLLSVQQGNFIGSIAPYGYNKTTVQEGKRKCHTLQIREDEATVVRMIFDMYVNDNLGRVTIARRLNALGIKPRKAEHWSQDVIKTILENEHYIGKVRWNWRKTVTTVEGGEISKTRPKTEYGEYMLFDGKHEPIVSVEIFRAARDKQGRNHRAKASTKVRNPLAGLLYCQCGRAMSLRTYNANGKERSAPRMLCDNQAYCKTSSCLYDDIIERVSDALKQCIEDFEIRIKSDNKDSISFVAKQINTLEIRKEELAKMEIAYWEAHSHPDPDKRMPDAVFESLKEKVTKEMEEVRQALSAARETIPSRANYEEKLHRFRDALEALKSSDVPAEQKNRLLKACIDRIDYSRGKSERMAREFVEDGIELPVGGKWASPPIELDIKLRL